MAIYVLSLVFSLGPAPIFLGSVHLGWVEAVWEREGGKGGICWARLGPPRDACLLWLGTCPNWPPHPPTFGVLSPSNEMIRGCGPFLCAPHSSLTSTITCSAPYLIPSFIYCCSGVQWQELHFDKTKFSSATLGVQIWCSQIVWIFICPQLDK